MLKSGDKVIDNKGNKGTVTIAYGGECVIVWANGMSGSFTAAQLAANGIKLAYPRP